MKQWYMSNLLFYWVILIRGIQQCHGFSSRSDHLIRRILQQQQQQQQQHRLLITTQQFQYQQKQFQYKPVSRTVLHLSQDSIRNDDTPKDNSNNKNNKKEEEVLTLSKIAELVDIAFVQACLQLAEGYVDTLKLMIASIQAAYVQGISPYELIHEINTITTPSAGRALLEEEQQLRDQWIHTVYVMLMALQYKVTDRNRHLVLDSTVQETFGSVAPIVIRRRQLSTDWNGPELLEATSSLLFLSPTTTNNPNAVQKAIALQTLRVMWVTMSVVEDIQRCEGEYAKMDAPLTPPIPGAFENEFLP